MRSGDSFRVRNIYFGVFRTCTFRNNKRTDDEVMRNSTTEETELRRPGMCTTQPHSKMCTSTTQLCSTTHPTRNVYNSVMLHNAPHPERVQLGCAPQLTQPGTCTTQLCSTTHPTRNEDNSVMLHNSPHPERVQLSYAPQLRAEWWLEELTQS